MERSVPIRSVSRSIAVLKAINRFGSLSMMEIARNTDLAYPTASRIIQTLLQEGLIEIEPTRKHYRATALVQTLSLGYRDQGHLLEVARPHMIELTKKFSWPITLATRVGHMMMVRDSTHGMTSLTFSNYQPGFTLPILECASGHAYLAYAPQGEFESVVQGLELINGKSTTLSLFQSGKLVKRIRENGYSTNERTRYSASPGKTSSLGAPLFEHDHLVGALTLTLFSSAMPIAEAAKRYANDLIVSAQKISSELSTSTTTVKTKAEKPFIGSRRRQKEFALEANSVPS